MTKFYIHLCSEKIVETFMGIQIFFLHSFLLILHFTFCFSKDTITINQTIHDGEPLISKEKNFVLGFFSPGSSRYRYLGIWYYKVRLQTVVWVANRNNPINGSSGVLSINQYGNLILYSNTNQKVPLWSTNVSVEVTDTHFAQLLDSGNLVLVQERSKKIVWQSFDYPTDTLLPGMKQGFHWKTGMHYSRTSWKSADDPGSGEYSVGINPKGSPQHFLYKGTKPCSRSLPWPMRNYVDERNFSFINNEDEVFLTYSPADTSLILRIVLDYSGQDKHLAWHESEGKWKETLSVPNYLCESYGHCGTYGKCDPLQLNHRRFECDCLPGYEPKSPRDWNILKDASGGCVRKRLESSSVCGDGEGFVKVANVKVPDATVAVWLSMNTSPMDCEQECKKNCSCSAYASIDITGKGIGCLAWFGELIDTVDHFDEGYDLYVRVDALELANNIHKAKRFLGRKGVLPTLVLSGVSTWFVIILFACLWLQKRRRRVANKWKKKLLDTLGDARCQKGVAAVNEAGDSRSHLDIAIFNLSTILAATNNFAPANRLGQGGFGSVYKGQLTNGQEVAVKRLDKNSLQGVEEFKNEVILISELQHKNLVKLLGCCIQGEEPMLIYEFLPNNSLDSLLFDETRKSILDWKIRFDIIVGIARGILYLHQDSRLRIIHRDLKASNILLDAEMNPKVSDFGMARIFKGEQIQERTSKVVGTFGYMSPEYVIFGKFSMKSDVFSYGVILLEIITGIKNNGLCKEDSSLTLIEYVWELWRENRAMEIVDSSIKESCVFDEVLRCIHIGLLCVQEDEMNRPTMFTVVLMLNSEISLPPPKQPAFILRRSYSNPNSQIREEISCLATEMTITN